MNLQLEFHTIRRNPSTDLLMFRIKESTIGTDISINSFGRVNQSFCHFVVDFLLMILCLMHGLNMLCRLALLHIQTMFQTACTRTWWPTEKSLSGISYRIKLVMQVCEKSLLQYSSAIINITPCFNIMCPGCSVFSKNPKWPMPPLKKLYSTLVKYKAKFANGVILSYKCYDSNKVGTLSCVLVLTMTIQFY